MGRTYEDSWVAAMEKVHQILENNYPRLQGLENDSYSAGWNACICTIADQLDMHIHTVNKGMGFGDEVQQGAARDLLRQTMSRISQERWCAGWLVDLEYLLWRDVLEHQRVGVRTNSGYGHDARDLAFLAAIAGGWWIFSSEDKTQVFIPFNEWRVLYRSWEKGH